MSSPRKLTRNTESNAAPQSDPSPTLQQTTNQAQSQLGKSPLGSVSGLTSGLSNTASGLVGQAKNTLGNTTNAVQRLTPAPVAKGLDQGLEALNGLEIGQDGQVLGKEGNPLGRLTEGDPDSLVGRTVGDNGEILGDDGGLIGRVEALPEAVQGVADQAKDAVASLAGLNDLPVSDGGLIKDNTGQTVGKVVEGDVENLVGYSPNDKGEILDNGNLVGLVEPIQNAQGSATDCAASVPQNGIEMRGAEEGDVEGNLIENQLPLSKLEGLQCNKMGKIIDSTGKPVGELIEGEAKKIAQLGATLDDAGQFWDNRGNIIGKAQTIDAQGADSQAPFAGLDGLHVVEGGWVEDNRAIRVGKIVEGNPKKLLGRAVDEDGDVIDQHGTTIARAEPWEEPEEPKPDLSTLEGKLVNKAGNVVDAQGNICGRITSGDARLAGRKVDGLGQIWGDNGQIIGQAELIPGAEAQRPEGPFFGFDDAEVSKDGVVVSANRVIGRVVEGDAKRLLGRKVDEDGDIQDKNGNAVGRAERWEPEEKPRSINPMSGRKVTREGEVRDADGNLIGKLTSGNLATLIGHEIDDNGYVVDNDGNKVGECTLLENIPEEEPEPGPSPEELEAQKKEAEDKQLAKKMSSIVGQTLDRVQPICRMISERTEKAERTPKEELDEEELVRNVKPLLEEGGRILQECNGAIRALDPDGHVASQAKARAASHEASPEEHTLADQLRELTETVTRTIDHGRSMIADMPHAKKELNPLWGLLSEPLFQIIAAVGLLLNGVLSLVGRLLDGLGLGGLVKGLLGGLGLDQLLSNLGLTSLTDAVGLTGGK